MLVRGKTYWCRILGQPGPGFDKTDRSQDRWSFDLALTPETKKEMIDLGLKSRIKNKEDERGDFIQFQKRAITSKGNSAYPIKVVDHRNQPWDEKVLIGNGSTLNVSFDIIETSYGQKKFLKPIVKAVQVWDLVPYSPKSAFPVDDSRPSTHSHSGFDVSEEAQTTDEEWS